jgi:hypothetical protein
VGALLTAATQSPKAAFVQKIKNLKTQLAATSTFEKSYTLEESLALIYGYLEPEVAEKFLNDAWTRLGSLKIVVKPIDPAKARLSYRSRFLDFHVNRSENAKIVWSDAVVHSQAELEAMLEATIDMFSQAAFIPVRRHTIYMATPATFMSHNIEVMKENLLLKLFVLGEDAARPAPSVASTVWNGAKAVCKAVLPTQFSSIRNLRLNRAHLDAYEADGPQGLYRYIKHRQGVGMAIKYWFNHITNLKAAIVFAYAAALTPNAVETWQYFASQQSFETSTHEQYVVASRMYEAMHKPPAELLAAIDKQLAELSPEERALVNDALSDEQTINIP